MDPLGLVLHYKFVAATLILCILLAKPTRISARDFPHQRQQATTTGNTVHEHTFYSIIDHFGFRPLHPNLFPLRYFVCDDHWTKPSDPVFFYAGNEADITLFLNNSGFMFETAAEFHALVVFAEHRYYGKSFPFGGAAQALTPQNISYLSVEQALADFNLLNVHIRKKWQMNEDAAFISFGGSYGANLAMWLRLKHPHLWAGAIASSATPLKHKLRESNGFNRIVAEVYHNVSSKCPDLIREGWKALFEGAETKAGREAVASELGLCRPLPNAEAANEVHDYISGALETMCQYGYPYPTSFYNPVPAYPFKLACENMVLFGTGLGSLRAAAEVYYNHTGQAGSCFDFFDDVREESAFYHLRKGQIQLRVLGENKHIEAATDSAWGYQTCTEVYQPMPTDGITDIEIPYTPNETAYFERCMKNWGVHPRPDWEEINFGSSDIGTGSNIFLASGQLDPWRAGGIQEKPLGAPDSIIVRTIEHGAHHLDLRGSNPNDPLSVINVRKEEVNAMHQWIKQWKDIHPSKASSSVE